MRTAAAPKVSAEAIPGEARPLLAPTEAGTESVVARASGDWPTVHRIVSLVAVLGLLWPEFKAWSDIVSAPLPGFATIMLTGGTLVLACLVARASTEEALERLDRWVLALGLLVLVVSVGWGLRNSSGYSTDEAAFVHGAAQLLLHGHDPYGANLLPSLAQFNVPHVYWTYTMSGGVVSTLGYPALPVLVAAPFVALLGNGQSVAIAEVVVLLIAIGATFAALPRPWRSMAVLLCVGFPALEGFAVAGLTAVLALPALIVVARRWTRVGESGNLSPPDRLAAVALGLAVSTNQLAWFIAPFVLVGILLLRQGNLEARRAFSVTSRWGGLAVLTFLVLNAPFIVWGPSAWWRGVAAPLSQHAIPYGQGLVGLTVFLGLGGGAIDAYTYVAVALYLGLLVVFAVHFRSLARCCFVLPVAALYASGRSLSEYWLVLVVPIVIGALTSDGASIKTAAQLSWPRPIALRVPAKIVMPTLFAPAAALLAAALLAPAPLSIQILRVGLNQQDTAVTRLWVAVHNRTDTPLRAHFAINSTGQASPFWRIVDGPAVLAGGAQARYVLGAPGVDTIDAGPFRLQAVTGSPRTISSSAIVRPRLTIQQGW
jgi:hypothetical protein